MQIADALDAAHAQGHHASRHQAGQHLCHQARSVKVLDFGLAKVTAPQRQTPPRVAAPTAVVAVAEEHFTSPGTSMGTVGLYVTRAGAREGLDRAYRPVLLRGRALRDGDRRVPFRGDTRAVIFDAILNRAAGAAGAAEPGSSAQAGRDHQ